MAKLPADVVGKLDAVIPHILVAEASASRGTSQNTSGIPWICGRFQGAASKSRLPQAGEHVDGPGSRTGFLKQAIALFRMALDAKKGEYVKRSRATSRTPNYFGSG
ncbi:MAG: hypothetical protein ACLSTO_06330 [Bilophila wadsworthia]